MVFIQILIATFLVSLISLLGVITLSLKEKILNKITFLLVALSAGALLGGAFIHLIPESIEIISAESTFLITMGGFALFFFIENILQWRHCHKGKCDIHSFAYMNLFGESIHNFLDGLIIAASFIINIPLGISTTIAVGLHEIPQELGDFGVLIQGGFKKSKAILLNFLTALFAILGGVIGYFLSTLGEISTTFLIPIAAGGFLYIAASDLIPEIRKESNVKKNMISFMVFIFGILIMYLVP